MKISSAVIALVLLLAPGVRAETTNTLSSAEIQGRELAQQICSLRPVTGFTNVGVLKIRGGDGKKSSFPISLKTTLTDTGRQSLYEATPLGDEALAISYIGEKPPQFRFHAQNGKIVDLDGTHTMSAFAGSDFWSADLGLEFFYWPQQKILKKEMRSSCACAVLESTNPNPETNTYSKVVAWVDTESLGVVEAYAYDFNGKKLKNFYPKDIKKVNGQWQVQTLVMENLQTGSKSRIEFDLNK